ncbi:MAG: hypothetical protein RBU23_04520 [Candidatus Auribacterota bacterium]|jgi:ABC-type polysaccharide/polyol phosphate transport system ATPase subunit|nr:hypothetical protein [Candidatus Auribacterota bacterium]
MIEFKDVSKILSSDIDVSRAKSLIKMVTGRETVCGELRPDQYFSIKNISFSISEGETFLVLGGENSGVDTIARLLGGLTYPSAGEITINGFCRLVSNGKMVSTPLMTLEEYLRLVVMIQTKNPSRLASDCAEIIEKCSLGEWKKVKIKNIPPATLKLVNFYTSIYLPADIFIFENIFSMGAGDFRQMCNAMVDEIIATKTVFLISQSYQNLPSKIDKAMIVHNGRSVFFGSYDEAVLAYDRLNKVMAGNSGDSIIPAPMADGFIFESDDDDDGDVVLTGTPCNAKYAKSYPEDFIKALDKLKKTEKFIFAGPYLSDVGYEILYWIPFLRWILKECEISPDRTIGVSRYGADAWYKDVCAGYCDILDVMSAEEFKDAQDMRMKKSGTIKQFEITEIESDILRKVAVMHDISDFDVVHPSIMYKLFTSVWNQTFPVDFILEHLDFEQIRHIPDITLNYDLPEQFVAVRFDTTAYIPETRQTRYMIKSFVEKISKRIPVVVLNTGLEVDFHKDWSTFFRSDNIFFLQGAVGCRENFLLQTVVMKRAKGFLGTHGGASYLGPFCGVPALTFYQNEIGNYSVHLDVSRALFKNKNDCRFDVFSLADIDPDFVADNLLYNNIPAGKEI